MPKNPNDLVQESILEGSKLGSRLFRNNVGLGWIGHPVIHIKENKSVNLKKGDVVVRNARALHAGLCEGSSDAIGLTPILITQEMVGKKIAVFTAVESKTGKGKLSKIQQDFINMVIALGGIAGAVYSRQDVQKLIKPIVSPVKQFFGKEEVHIIDGGLINEKYIPKSCDVITCKYYRGIKL